MSRIQINGRAVEVRSAPETPLLWVLRDELGMTGTKFGCGLALCGACTVHLDGQPIRACTTPVSAVGSQPLSTIEGQESDRLGRIVQQAWVELNVAQCGYCQPGQIMSAVGLLRGNSNPNDQQIDEAMSGNLCRCGTYPRIRAAIQLAARRAREGARA
jgi:isoquinoline 1-oxidoreductase subunit alpha